MLLNNTGGGGGHGHPFDREPERVARDVRNGYVSVEAAAAVYGVSVDSTTFLVDEERTAEYRRER